LAAVAAPDNALITCIGSSHLEFFGNFEGVAREKGDLLSACPDDATVYLPAKTHASWLLRRKAGRRPVVTFGDGEEADVRGVYLGPCDGGYKVRLVRKATGESCEFVWGIGGAHQAVNAAAAAAVGLDKGVTMAEIAAGLAECTLPGKRMNVVEKDGIHWVNDAYNASPDSMRAGIRWFGDISAAARQLVILGDMRELGAHGNRAHDEILSFAAKSLPHAKLVTVGPLMEAPSRKHGITHVVDVQQLAKIMPSLLSPGTWVYLKASNAIGLHALVETLHAN
jgi:UDP-N-acetylmuramoyl-tripeptide--D-alanyl-D-alanine ligase